MDAPRNPFTPEVQHDIAAFLRAGAFLRVAVEAAGVDWNDYRRWLTAGNSEEATSQPQQFRREVRRAQAQGRLRAETEVFQKQPLQWLKHGPGRQRPGHPGWAALPRSASRSRGARRLLDVPANQRLFARLLAAVEQEPHVRARLAEVLEEPPQ